MNLYRLRHSSPYQHAFAMLAAILLLVAHTSHLHVRYCLDGDGPLISVHAEAQSTHSEDSEHDEGSADIENELSIDSAIAKILDDSQFVAVLRAIYLAPAAAPKTAVQYASHQNLPPQSPHYRTPPLRAPPSLA